MQALDKNLYGQSLGDLEDWMKKEGFPAYRASQLFGWLQDKQAKDFTTMTNLPKKIKKRLAEEGYHIHLPEIIKKSHSADRQTFKLLLGLADGHSIETVLMRYDRQDSRKRNTVCVSSQVGCAMGCSFCATGQAGISRNLSAGEIVGQVLLASLLLEEEEGLQRVSNVVYMGMGEPLNNYQAVLKSIHILSHSQGLNIGKRRISLSTCGLVPKIRQLAQEKLPITLAISLHASRNDLRDQLIPVNKSYPLESLIEACKDYFQATGRRITFEYTLIDGVNDSREDAQRLSKLIRGFPASINLIPLNEVSHASYKTAKAPQAFARRLEELGLDATIRQEMGGQIQAACGQLKERQQREQE